MSSVLKSKSVNLPYGMLSRNFANSHIFREESGKPKLILEDHNSFDVEDWIVNVLAGTQFPVICCVSSCRILGAVGDKVCIERNFIS